MLLCPNGHQSRATDYCDVCGSPIEQWLPRPQQPPAPPTRPCPNCGAPCEPDALFCEECGYDFTTGTKPRGAVQPKAPHTEPSTPVAASEAAEEPASQSGLATVSAPVEHADPTFPIPGHVEPEPSEPGLVSLDLDSPAASQPQFPASVAPGAPAPAPEPEPVNPVPVAASSTVPVPTATGWPATQVPRPASRPEVSAEPEPPTEVNPVPVAGPQPATPGRQPDEDPAAGRPPLADQESAQTEPEPEPEASIPPVPGTVSAVEVPPVFQPEPGVSEPAAADSGIVKPPGPLPVKAEPPDHPDSYPASKQTPPRLMTGPAQWVAEVWIDPDWYAAQASPAQLPSPGRPRIIGLRAQSNLIGRVSSSRGILPAIDCDPDVGVSRRQANLSTDGTRWWVEDLGSSNGTYLGQVDMALATEPIAGRTQVGVDDRIYVGSWTRIAVRRALASEADL